MNTSTPTRPVPRSPWSAIVGVALAVLAVGGGWLLWREPAVPSSRPAPGDVVLDVRHDFADGPLERRLLAPQACVFEVDVTAAADLTVTATLGPPLPATRTSEGGPDPSGSTVLRGTGVAGQVRPAIHADVRVYGAGIQVLSVTAVAPNGTKDRSASIRVRRRPGP